MHGHGSKTRLECADHKRDHPRIAVAPRGYPVGTDIGTRPQVVDSISIAARLDPGVNLLPRFAAARAEITMVVKQNGQAGCAKDFRIVVERHGNGGGRAMGHDDNRKGRRTLRAIKTAAQERALGREFYGLEHLYCNRACPFGKLSCFNGY